MEKELQFSVIIPAYNCADTIGETIESIQNANLFDYEIIIVDDGSTDRTIDVCRKIAEESPLVSCVQQQNGGVSSARNKGIELARGKYILFIDADDKLRPFIPKDIHDAANANADLIMFGMTFSYYWKERLLLEERLSTSFRGLYGTSDISGALSELFFKNYLSPVWNKLFRRQLFLDENLRFNLGLTNYEDLELSLRALAKSKTILVLKEPYYEYRIEYGVDRTKDRIAKIDDITGNTDIIARAFFDLEEQIHKQTGELLEDMPKIVLQIYTEIFRQKMLTTKRKQISRYCLDFTNDEYVRHCIARNDELKQEKTYVRMTTWSSLKLLLFYRYRELRHWVASKVKLALYLWRSPKDASTT